MRTLALAIIVLICSVGTSAQLPRHAHKWHGNMDAAKHPEYQTQKTQPPTAVCNDGSLSYESSGGGISHVCEKGHKGVRQYVANQFISVSGHTITEPVSSGMAASARSSWLAVPHQKQPEANSFWLHPVLSNEKVKRYSSDALLPGTFNTPVRRVFSFTGLFQ
jgi:hypothetical protein